MANSLFLHDFLKPKSSLLPFLILLLSLIISTFVPQQLLCQQTYVGSAPATTPTASCTRQVDASPGYTSNGVFGACHTFITFRATAPYRTIHSISRLFKTDPSLISAAATINITESTVLELNQLVVIEANCSSPGITSYYKTSYISQTGDSVYSIANQVYQGLTTCRAIFDHNPPIINQTPIAAGTEIMVPVRCACPTETQTEDGIKSLLTYIVTDGDTVVDVSARFKVDQGLTFKANKISKHHRIYPFTTLLLPIVRTRPDMSEAEAQAQPPSPRHDQYVMPSSPSKAKKSSGAAVLRFLFILLGIAGTVGLGITLKINQCTCIVINKVPPGEKT